MYYLRMVTLTAIVTINWMEKVAKNVIN